MAAGATYAPIATTAGTGSSTTITFTSIPQTYTDLVLIIDQITPGANNYGYNIRFNNNSGGSTYWLEGQSNYGTSMVRFWSANDAIYPNYSTNLSTYGGSAYMDILDYTSTTHLKPWILQNTNISPTKSFISKKNDEDEVEDEDDNSNNDDTDEMDMLYNPSQQHQHDNYHQQYHQQQSILSRIYILLNAIRRLSGVIVLWNIFFTILMLFVFRS